MLSIAGSFASESRASLPVVGPAVEVQVRARVGRHGADDAVVGRVLAAGGEGNEHGERQKRDRSSQDVL